LLILAFISFSICASSVYIVNDLADLESDRAHPRKRFRPFASGLFSLWMGILIAPILFFISLWIGSFVGDHFFNWLVLYIFLTTTYTCFLKRVILIDCIVLALLYTIRVIAGAAAIGQPLSFWLLAFSVFLFLSLAFVKRYAELEVQIKRGREKICGRGYLSSDAPLILTIGVVGGYVSVLVLALYLNSEAVVKLYRAPEVIWGVVPVMLFWISWIWMQAHRGDMHDDPIIFAIKDKASLAAGVLFALIIFIGAMGFVW
jgi:4-hydroxybenzoate polyprenyltransferase